jgi:nucleotide-binding universal stress UspA family protein
MCLLIISQKGVGKMEKIFFKRILVATDGSESAVNAASHGIKIAKATGAEVFALYGISTEYAVKHERLGVGQMNLKNFLLKGEQLQLIM